MDGTRELVLSPYIVVYEAKASRVFVLHIYHAAQDWPVRV
jgi:plasmid stabilization system protein ParE